MNARTTGLLDSVAVPADLRRLPERRTRARLRRDLQRITSSPPSLAGGGHLAAGLGAVELTVALHYVFDTPRDALVWDVGHQALRAQGPHRAARPHAHIAPTRRPFRLPAPRREPVRRLRRGHSSTSISAALGIAVAGARSARPTQDRRDHRRRRADGRPAVRGPAAGGRAARPRPAGHRQRQRHVDFPERRFTVRRIEGLATAQARDGQPVSVRGWFEAAGLPVHRTLRRARPGHARADYSLP